MKWVIGCFCFFGVIICLLYFITVGLLSEFVENEERILLQLSDELDLSPKFKTNEKLFAIDDDKIKQNNQVLNDSFVIKYDKYPKTLINSLLSQNNLFDKSATNHQPPRHIPFTIQQYNNTAIDLCETRKAWIEPQAAKINDRWIIVINQDNFKQMIPVEWCGFSDNNLQKWRIQDSENLKCRQIESKIDLIVLMHNVFLSYQFSYPSACEPYYG